MCNNLAVTATNDQWQRAILFHQTATRGTTAAPGNPDGWGISDGKTIEKDVNAYVVNPNPGIVFSLEPERIITAHNRAASPNTGRTRAEVHPWLFTYEDVSFVAQHNGNFNDSWRDYVGPQTTSDSFRAFTRLAKLLYENKGEFTIELVAKWLSAYGTRSAFAVMIHYNGNLILFRNKERLLSYAEYGNGYIVQTHKHVIEEMQAWADTFLPDIEIGKAYEIPPDVLIELAPGTQEIVRCEALEYKLDSFPKAVQTPSVATSTPTSQTAGKEEAKKEVQTVGPERQTPTQTTGGMSAAFLETVEAHRNELWETVLDLLHPLRHPLAICFVAYLLGNQEENSQAWVMNPEQYTIDQLIVAGRTIKKEPFSDEEIGCIETWNFACEARDELEMHFNYVDVEQSGVFIWELSEEQQADVFDQVIVLDNTDVKADIEAMEGAT